MRPLILLLLTFGSLLAHGQTPVLLQKDVYVADGADNYNGLLEHPTGALTEGAIAHVYGHTTPGGGGSGFYRWNAVVSEWKPFTNQDNLGETIRIAVDVATDSAADPLVLGLNEVPTADLSDGSAAHVLGDTEADGDGASWYFLDSAATTGDVAALGGGFWIKSETEPVAETGTVANSDPPNLKINWENQIGVLGTNALPFIGWPQDTGVFDAKRNRFYFSLSRSDTHVSDYSDGSSFIGEAVLFYIDMLYPERPPVEVRVLDRAAISPDTNNPITTRCHTLQMRSDGDTLFGIMMELEGGTVGDPVPQIPFRYNIETNVIEYGSALPIQTTAVLGFAELSDGSFLYGAGQYANVNTDTQIIKINNIDEPFITFNDASNFIVIPINTSGLSGSRLGSEANFFVYGDKVALLMRSSGSSSLPMYSVSEDNGDTWSAAQRVQKPFNMFINSGNLRWVESRQQWIGIVCSRTNVATQDGELGSGMYLTWTNPTDVFEGKFYQKKIMQFPVGNSTTSIYDYGAPYFGLLNDEYGYFGYYRDFDDSTGPQSSGGGAAFYEIGLGDIVRPDRTEVTPSLDSYITTLKQNGLRTLYDYRISCSDGRWLPAYFVRDTANEFTVFRGNERFAIMSSETSSLSPFTREENGVIPHATGATDVDSQNFQTTKDFLVFAMRLKVKNVPAAPMAAAQDVLEISRLDASASDLIVINLFDDGGVTKLGCFNNFGNTSFSERVDAVAGEELLILCGVDLVNNTKFVEINGVSQSISDSSLENSAYKFLLGNRIGSSANSQDVWIQAAGHFEASDGDVDDFGVPYTLETLLAKARNNF